MAIYEDVTAQKMAEEALKSSEERLNLTLNAVKVGIWECGKMWLSLHLMDDNQIELIVADNGSGLPDDFNLDSSNSLGMQLVKSLVNQLDGSIKINRANGTEFNIQFKELIYANRI